MLCWLYYAMLRSQNDSRDGLSLNKEFNDKDKAIKKIIDEMGSYIIDQLIQVNKNRLMNSQLFR